ncbi:MAG TPA: hypothetical protein VFZ40_07460, partial [Pyrinomonadaceae bacterium]
DKRRAQSADDLQQEIVSVLAFVSFRTRGEVSNQRGAFGFVKQDDSAEAGLPFEPVYGRWQTYSAPGGMMDNYQIVQHALILEIPNRLLS